MSRSYYIQLGIAVRIPMAFYRFCDEEHREIFDQMVRELDYATVKASNAQDEIQKRMTEEIERNLGEKFGKNTNFS